MLRRQINPSAKSIFGNNVGLLVRFFSSSSLNQPPGVSADDLLSNIKSSHQATAGLRFAETQRRQDEEIMSQQTQKYRDGLVNPAAGSAKFGGLDPHVKSFSDDSNSKNKSAQTGSSSLHFRAPSNPLTIGRDPLILSLWQSILAGRRALFLTGGDGMGASTVASQFAEHARRSGRFSCIQWFDCSRTVSNASDEVAGTSIREPAVEQLKKFVKQMRERSEDEVLLIFDHPENPVEILKALHATFAAMKKQQSSSEQQQENNNNNNNNENQVKTPQEAASPAQYLFSGPPKLSDTDLRAHYSRLHLLFVTPQKFNAEKTRIVNVIDELLGVNVSISHREQTDDNNNNKITSSFTLASEFCPAVFNVEPVDEVPAMLLVERLIQNNISEYHHNQLQLDNNLKKTKNLNNNNNSGFSDEDGKLLPPPPPALHDNHLLALCDRVARVPLLLVLAAEFVAAELMTSPRMRDLTAKGEVLVGDEEEALFHEIIDRKLTQSILAPTMRNKTEANPEGSLSVSAAAAGLCIATMRSILPRTGENKDAANSIIITPELVEKIILSLAQLNVADLSHEIVEAVIVEIAKQDPASAVSSFLTATSANREQVVNEVELLLRRCGVLSDSLVFNDFVTNSKIKNNSMLDEEIYTCHVALADGLLNIKKSKHCRGSVDAHDDENEPVYRALFNMFVKAKARNDFYGQLRVARHLEALVESNKKNIATAAASCSASSSVQRELFDRVASFLTQHLQLQNIADDNKNNLTNFVRKIWLSAFNQFSSSSSTTEQKEIAGRIGLDLSRLLLALNNNRMKEIQKLQQEQKDSNSSPLLKRLEEQESEEYDFIANLLSKASQLSLSGNNNNNNITPKQMEHIVASKNLLWAEITSLRARMMDPEKKETLDTFSAAAQIIENHLGSASPTPDSKIVNVLKEEYFVLLVAWAESAKYLKLEVPEQHWNKIKKMSNELTSSLKNMKQ